MKKRTLLALIAPIIVMLSGCTRPSYDIVVTMYPQYDIARAIVKDRMSVHSILPPGVEVHDYEATSSDIVLMNKAKLVIYTSAIIDTWMNTSVIENDQTKVIELAHVYDEIEELHLETEHDDHDHDHDDIHFWVDPLAITHLTEHILEEIVLLDPENSDFYQYNADKYIDEINETYEQFMIYLEAHDLFESTLYFAGHNAMGLFGARHHLDIHGLFSNFKPDEDLGSLQLIEFTNIVRESGTNHLFIEEMVTPKAALTIKNELALTGYNLTLLELHAYHNVSQSDAMQGVSYIDLYQRNINNIKLALSI